MAKVENALSLVLRVRETFVATLVPERLSPKEDMFLKEGHSEREHVSERVSLLWGLRSRSLYELDTQSKKPPSGPSQVIEDLRDAHEEGLRAVVAIAKGSPTVRRQ